MVPSMHMKNRKFSVQTVFLISVFFSLSFLVYSNEPTLRRDQETPDCYRRTHGHFIVKSIGNHQCRLHGRSNGTSLSCRVHFSFVGSTFGLVFEDFSINCKKCVVIYNDMNITFCMAADDDHRFVTYPILSASIDVRCGVDKYAKRKKKHCVEKVKLV